MQSDQPLHVLHVVPTLRVGGMELALSRIVNGLAGRGITGSVVCLTGEPAIRDRFDAHVQVHCMHARPNEWGLPWRLRALLRRLRPQVIHARNWGAWPDIALARLSLYPPIPLIFSFHGLAGSGPMPWRQRLAYRLLARMTTRVFTVSQASRQFLVNHVGLPGAALDVIPNGVDTVRFRPAAGRVPGAMPVIGTVGSLAPVKNQALLIRAVGGLLARGLDVRLDIAGEGPEKTRLDELAHSLGIARRLRLLGHVADVPAFMNSLDIFVLPSDSEAHPNALLEAMACALPCVGTRVGGVPEVLGSCPSSLLIDAGDQAGLTAALAELVADPARRAALGRAGRECILRHYSMAQMMDAYAALYASLAGRPHAAS
ncbi:MAG: glycosyltransferase family 4 protein [Pseudomonadota bacterium]|nr:glycosyltransferase family 4 protein [Pseudomonadota bacterium]